MSESTSGAGLEQTDRGAPIANGWIAVQKQVHGGNKIDFYWTTNWDGSLHPTSDAAMRHGFEQFGSDDFNLGRIDQGKLVWWGWMSEPILEDLETVAADLGLRVTIGVAGPPEPGRCTSRHRHYRAGGEIEIVQCELQAPHADEPPYGFAAKGCHRNDGHFWTEDEVRGG